VGLADTVQNVTADGAHESSVDGRESTSREGPFLGRVVGKDGVSVLEVGDHDEPVVDVEVRDKVGSKHLEETPLDGPVGKTCHDGENTNVGSENLPLVLGSEEDGRGREVVGSIWILPLAGRVSDQVRRPAKDLVQGAVPELDDRGILKSFSELVLTVLSNGSSGELLVVLGGRKTLLGSGCGNKDLVSLEVASGSVVLTV